MEDTRRRSLISAFVISYNCETTISCCLKSLSFADEIILVDKSSTDGTIEKARGLADRVVVIPWSPTAEETRSFASDLCAHEIIVFLDADECLNVSAIEYFNRELRSPNHDYYIIPRNEFIIGVHDRDAYYWPEHHTRAYVKGSIRFVDTIHAGIEHVSLAECRIQVDSGIAIEHFSHENVYQWIEKANRYTSIPNRRLMHANEPDLIEFAHECIDHWVKKSRNINLDSYPAAVAMLRSTYDLIDRLKSWEHQHTPDGALRFQSEMVRLNDAYAELGLLKSRQTTVSFDKGAEDSEFLGAQSAALDRAKTAALTATAARDGISRQLEQVRLEITELATSRDDLQAEKAMLKSQVATLREAVVKLSDEAGGLRAINQHTAQQLGEASRELHILQTSSSMRLTAPLRRIAQRNPSIARRGMRIVRLAYWTATMRLLQRLREERSVRLLNRSTMRTDRSLKKVQIPSSFAAPASETPVVSIVIPTYGQNEYTRLCLYSLHVNPPRTQVEIIVIDDAHPDNGSQELKQSIHGPLFVSNDKNLGFLKTCNAAARLCKGRYIFFLNNDTEVMSDAIDALVDLLDTDPTVGLTGSKLIYPDGTLQEAGGIVWSDASAWNFGRNSDPKRPEYNYRREVDYISGAAIMVRKSMFDELNGFDEIFAPAYYEDTDLAFRTRAYGLRVVFEPRSVVIHHEGKSHGTDVSSGGKAYQIRNAVTMKDRWLPLLSKEHYPNGHSVLRARDRARGRSVILVVDHYVPEPDRDAGSRSTIGVLGSLVQAGWDVKFWPENRAYSPEYTPRLEAMGIETLDGRSPESLGSWLASNRDDIDHVMLMRPDTASAALPIIAATVPRARLSYYGHDIHFERMRREAELTGDTRLMAASDRMELLERSLWRQFNVVIYLSEEEASLVRKIEPAVNAASIVGFARTRFIDRQQPTVGSTILFVAGFAHPPNVDAAKYLVREVMPIVWNEHPQAKLALVGSKPTQEVVAFASANVIVTGWVNDEDLHAWYDRARICVIPLRFGAGVKGKVVEALCEGVPLVTTQVGAQGIKGLDDIAPIATNTAEFAAAVIRLLTNDAAWSQQSAAQTSFGRANFSVEAMRASILKAIEDPDAAPSGPKDDPVSAR